MSPGGPQSVTVDGDMASPAKGVPVAGPPAGLDRRLLILVAKQRSGTHAFTRLLGSAPEVQNLGEVFFAFAKMLPGTFFEFRQNMIRQIPRLAFPSEHHQAELWNGYCRQMAAQYGESLLLMDIKYNSWHHFNPVWQNPSDPPAMIKLVRKQRLPVIHLIRSNKFSQACSEQIALRRMVWDSSQRAHARDERPISLPPEVLEQHMARSKLETEMFRRYFEGYERYVELTYEESFADNRLSPKALAGLQAVTDRPGLGEGLETPLRKVISDLNQTLGNAKEIRRYFAKTQWAQQVEASFDSTRA